MIQRAYKYRFYPTAEQEQLLRQTLGCVRLVYNKALALRTDAWYQKQERVGYNQTSNALTHWKREEELSFLKDVSSVPLQQSLRHLQTAFTNFFASRAKYPNFKKKRNGGSATFTRGSFSLKDGQVWLAKCNASLPIRWSRQLPKDSDPSSLTVKLSPTGRWTVSILVDEEIQKLEPVTAKVGIDLGITSLATLSTGEKIANPRTFKVKRRKLAKRQKALARKQKGSKNRYKARLKVAKAYAEITDARNDFLQKLTTKLIRENQTIVVETLAVKNMVKNHKLAQAISEASWSELVHQLEYKADWYGRELIKIDQWFPSSKRCGNCGYIVDKLPLSIREWTCPSCNTRHDRDVNASRNLLAVGLTVAVCGATVRPEESKSRKASAMKQKPSEAILGIPIF